MNYGTTGLLQSTIKSGKFINAWLYEPSTPGPNAMLVIGAGIGLVKSGGLLPFAATF